MYWKKWIEKYWWILLFPIIVPAGIFILIHLNRISEVKEIIKKESLTNPTPHASTITSQSDNIYSLNRCFDCGKSNSPLFWLLTELGGNKFCSECYRVYYKLVIETNCG
jgi:hypothetical protein